MKTKIIYSLSGFIVIIALLGLDTYIKNYELRKIVLIVNSSYSDMREWNESKVKNYDKYVGSSDIIGRLLAPKYLQTFVSDSNEIGIEIYRKKIQIEEVSVLPWHLKVKKAQEKSSDSLEILSDTLTSVRYVGDEISWGQNDLVKPFLEMGSSLKDGVPFLDFLGNTKLIGLN